MITFYVCVPELSGIVTQVEGNNGRIRVSSESVMSLRHRPFLSFRVFSKKRGTSITRRRRTSLLRVCHFGNVTINNNNNVAFARILYDHTLRNTPASFHCLLCVARKLHERGLLIFVIF